MSDFNIKREAIVNLNKCLFGVGYCAYLEKFGTIRRRPETFGENNYIEQGDKDRKEIEIEIQRRDRERRIARRMQQHPEKATRRKSILTERAGKKKAPQRSQRRRKTQEIRSRRQDNNCNKDILIRKENQGNTDSLHHFCEIIADLPNAFIVLA